MMCKKVLLGVVLILSLVSCSEGFSSAENFFSQKDCSVPKLLEVSAIDENVMLLEFDEEITCYGNGLDGYEYSTQGKYLYVTLPESLDAGSSLVISARVADLAGNTVGFTTPVWGLNSNPAKLLINELTLSSSEKQPQRTELYVSIGGYLSGMCLYSGIPDNYSERVVLPSVHVNTDSYIVVWWLDETKFRDLFSLSEGYWCETKGVLNVCASADTKLPASNGIICLAVSPAPGAKISDCVIYSKKNAVKFNGFGTESLLEAATYLSEKGHWVFEEIDAHYAADISNCTTTRSLCRRNFSDTDSCDDWYTVATGCFTFGLPNSEEEYKTE